MNNSLIAAVVAAPLVAGSSFGGYKLYQDYQIENSRARILEVAETTTIEKVPVSRQECWQEKVVNVHYENQSTQAGKVGSTALGAVIGGAVGNQIGDGRGRDAATVVAAIIGGKIGHDVYQKNHQPKPVETVSYEPRCKTVTDYNSVEKPNGYNVTYEFQGETYTTHMDEAPQGEYLTTVPSDATKRDAG